MSNYKDNTYSRVIGNSPQEQERYLYLITKFFGGKDLWERTELNNERGLIEMCMGECSVNFFSDYFCAASIRTDIDCEYAKSRVDGGNPYQRCVFFDKLLQEHPQSTINPEWFQNPSKYN